MTRSSINLIESKTAENPQLTKADAVLKRISYIAVITLVISGLLVGGLFTYLQLRETQVKNQADTIIAGITQDSAKEGLLTAIKERITVIDKILAGKKHVNTLFTLITDIVPPGNLTTVSLDDAGKVTIVASVASVPEAVTMVDSVLTLGTTGKLTKAALGSFGLSQESGLEISLSFVPVL